MDEKTKNQQPNPVTLIPILNTNIYKPKYKFLFLQIVKMYILQWAFMKYKICSEVLFLSFNLEMHTMYSACTITSGNETWISICLLYPRKPDKCSTSFVAHNVLICSENVLMLIQMKF